MHIKRKTIPIFWPVPKTGTKYVAAPTHNQYSSVPLIIFVRDFLKIVKNKKELKKLLSEKKILINGKPIKEINYPVCFFDSLSFPSIKKYYRAVLENKRLVLKEITEKESNSKIYRVINKKILPKNKIQLNLSDGKNILSSEKVNAGDFVLLNNTENKIEKIISLKKGTEVIVIKGKNMGKQGKIKEIVSEGNNFVAKIESKEGEINANIKNLFAVG